MSNINRLEGPFPAVSRTCKTSESSSAYFRFVLKSDVSHKLKTAPEGAVDNLVVVG